LAAAAASRELRTDVREHEKTSGDPDRGRRRLKMAVSVLGFYIFIRANSTLLAGSRARAKINIRTRKSVIS